MFLASQLYGQADLASVMGVVTDAAKALIAEVAIACAARIVILQKTDQEDVAAQSAFWTATAAIDPGSS